MWVIQFFLFHNSLCHTNKCFWSNIFYSTYSGNQTKIHEMNKFWLNSVIDKSLCKEHYHSSASTDHDWYKTLQICRLQSCFMKSEVLTLINRTPSTQILWSYYYLDPPLITYKPWPNTFRSYTTHKTWQLPNSHNMHNSCTLITCKLLFKPNILSSKWHVVVKIWYYMLNFCYSVLFKYIKNGHENH